MNAASFPFQNASGSPSALLPRSLGAILALLCLGGVAAYSVSSETPTGRVRGRVLLKENGHPLAKARLTLSPASDEDRSDSTEIGDGEGIKRIRAVTDADGNFQLRGVPVGFYHLSAATHAHSIDETTVFVNEDETTDLSLKLQRSQPELEVTQQQQEFLPSEKIVLPVQGYVDGAKTAGQDTMRVRIFRTTLANLLRDTKASSALTTISSRYNTEASRVLPTTLLHPASAAAPQLVSMRLLPLKGADIEGFFHQRLDLGPLQPGLYLVDVSHGKNAICAQMKVSNSALVVKKAGDQLLAYTVDSQSGAPRPRASVRVFQGGKVIATATTDTQGLARIPIQRSQDQAHSGDHLLTLASIGGNEATVGQYDYSGDDEGHGEFTVHSYTDRPIYRPGGRVSFKSIVRRTLDAGSRYAVPAGEAVAVEVRDPSGERVSQAKLTANAYGSVHDDFELSPEAPTGSYSIVTTVGGEEHTDDFTVASYRKPEFSAMVTPNEKHYTFGDTVEMMVNASYYFGSPVAGAKVSYTIYRTPDWASLYGDESDADAGDDTISGEEEDGEDGGDSSGEYVSDGNTTLDANGNAIISFPAQLESESEESSADSEGDITPDEGPQDQIYSVEVSVTDASDRETEASGTVPVSAGDFQLSTQTSGTFAAPKTPLALTVTARDFDDKPVANTPVTVQGSYRQWNDDYTQWKESPAGTYRATTNAKGVAKISLAPAKEGVLYLSAQAQDSRGRAIVATQSVWVSSDEGGDYDAQYGDLSLLADKKQYTAGETARVLLNSEHTGGTALLTVEGSKLFKAWLVKLDHRSTAIKVPLGANYGPNITLAACLVQNKSFARSDVPLKVLVPQRNIRVAIHSDRNKYKPGEKISYQVQTSDAKGKPVACDLSFGVVDESIYALQEDSPGALRAAFYPHNANSVQTSYSFEPLYLGDVNKAEPDIEARSKFLDTAFWRSDLQTDQSGKASVSFALPDNLTTWRATAVAETLDTAFGRRTQKVVVAKDFFVRLDAPRFFTGGDDTQVTALVHNDTNQEQDATVKIDAQGLALDGEATKTLHIGPGEIAKVNWPVNTDANGLAYSNLAHLKLTAWTPRSSSGVQLSDGVEATIPVRPHGRESIQNFVGHLVGSGGVTQKIAIDPKAIPVASRVTVRITPSVSDALVGALEYLTGFPYGCTEQTMSRFLPDILVQRTMRLQGLQDEKSRALKQKLPRMVRDGVTRLGRFQHESGGWGWWETDDDDPWMTAYVLYGLSQARAEGYSVPSDMLEKGREAATKMLRVGYKGGKNVPIWQRTNWQDTNVFLLYALAGAAPTPEQLALVRRVRLKLPTATLAPQSLGYLTMLDQRLGLVSHAWEQLEGQMQTEGDSLAYWKGNPQVYWADWDDKTATAVGLRALLATDASDARVPKLLLWLMTQREDNTWGSTRDTAWTLGALCDYLDSPQNVASAAGTLQVSLNGKTLKSLTIVPGKNSEEIVLRVPWNALRSKDNALKLQRSTAGQQPLFYTVQVRQTVASDGELAPVTAKVPITITREYRRVLPPAKGANSWTIQSEPTNNNLKQGDRVRVRLSFDVPQDMSYVLIEDPFPSGCEVTERGSADEGNDDWEYWWSSTDVRDDRIAFFARHLSKGKHTIEYNLRAQTPGQYVALPTHLEPMYAPEMRAETGETKVSIQ